jgi:uncharacterized protein (TIGR01777 family)
MKIVLAGGSGALGRRLAQQFAGLGAEIVILTRRPRAELPYRQVLWDGSTVGEWQREIDGAVLINLAGELVDRRPTRRNVALLTESRVAPTHALAVAAEVTPPAVLIQLSTLAIYGDAGDVVLDESASPADGPPQMAGVAKAWEATAADVAAGRKVVLRTGIVLDRDTPAFDRLAGLVRWGLGGRVGSGEQWVSWLHIDDFLSIVVRAATDPSVEGLLHATSPNPVRNREMMRAFRRVLHRPPSPPTPRALVRLGALVLRTDPALALTGRRCVPSRLTELGFDFAHPEIEEALRQILGSADGPSTTPMTQV